MDSIRIDDVRDQVAESPFYLYSKDRITANYTAYAEVRSSRKAVRLEFVLTLVVTDISPV